MIEQRGVVRFLWAKNMEAKDIHKEQLTLPNGQHFFVDILHCIHIFCPQKTHNATLFYRGTCIQGRRHLVTAVTSVQSRACRSLCVKIKLDSAAI
jgi:4-hydroxyphenylpyruvate dioxygenase-like putative hemolysin